MSIKRDASITSPVKLELIVPRHVSDIAADPVTAPGEANQASLTIRLGPSPGPLSAPVLLRATAERNGDPIIAESPLELVLEDE